MQPDLRQIQDWLNCFQRCVRNLDYAGALQLFSPDVIGFGTFTERAVGARQLAEQQWGKIWPHIENFHFNADRLVCHFSQDNQLVCITIPWMSTGFDSASNPFARNGRATILLIRNDAIWLAQHTHFSLLPGTASYTRKRLIP